ncbi:hypothetical protein JTB14_026778 [Gonioctena quinquepunctata]|nr:hypothetical protein JTB14_026778 [Gonioctena quinquepunctata]
MQNVKKNGEVFVTLIFTESTSSLLKLGLPHLEHLHPENSKVCLITPSDYRYFKKRESKQENSNSSAGTSKDTEVPSNVEEIYVNISSDVALFSKTNRSSSSCMYEISDDDLLRETVDIISEIFESRKIRNRPLLSARSVAHANNLHIHSNNIYVSLLESNSKSSSECICRICHGGESLDDLLTPCRCRGTIALVHLKCLERWLRESNHSTCELCQHHFKIVREPQYSIPRSVLTFLRHPGPHLKNILWDLVGFSIYTPSAIASTYMLMMICDTLAKANVTPDGTFSSHIIIFSTVFGMAAIDFTYTSWLLVTLQRHIDAWKEWHRSKSTLKVVLPKIKLRPHRLKKAPQSPE